MSAAPSNEEAPPEGDKGLPCAWEVSDLSWAENGCAEVLAAEYDIRNLLGAWRTPREVTVVRSDAASGQPTETVEDAGCHLWVTPTSGSYFWLWNQHAAVDVEISCRDGLWLRGTLGRDEDRSHGAIDGTFGTLPVRYEVTINPIAVPSSVVGIPRQANLTLKRVGEVEDNEPIEIRGAGAFEAIPLDEVVGFGADMTPGSCTAAVDSAYEACVVVDRTFANDIRQLATEHCSAELYSEAWRLYAALAKRAAEAR